jgi:hypothetical protein
MVMADEFTIAGAIVSGPKGLVLDVPEESKAELAKAVRYWRKPGPVTIRIREGKEPKSVAQLRYLHGKVFRDIAEETGNRVELVKDELKKKFLARLEEFTDLETGEVTTRVYVPSLSELDREQVGQFIDECVLWAAEWLSMTIEPPDPNWRDKKAVA